MRLSHKTEAELMAEKLLPRGDYPFEIIKGTDEVVEKEGAYKGKTYLKLTLRIYEDNGNFRAIDDTIWDELKLIRVCAAIGKDELLKKEKVHAEDLVGGAGNLSLEIKEDKTGQYPPKNVVKLYKKLPEVKEMQKDPFEGKKDVDFDDEVPY